MTLADLGTLLTKTLLVYIGIHKDNYVVEVTYANKISSDINISILGISRRPEGKIMICNTNMLLITTESTNPNCKVRFAISHGGLTITLKANLLFQKKSKYFNLQFCG